MLRSLFGELYPLRDLHKARKADPFPPTEFAATAVLEHTTRSISRSGVMVDRHIQDLFVSGAPAQGMRAHFAKVLAESPAGQRFITIVDPAQMWGPAVVKALSEAGGQVIERLHLRDQATLHTLAMIERTSIHRRSDETLKIYHADVRAQGRDAAAISVALMERADMTVVIVGPLHPGLIEEQIRVLQAEMAAPTWRCPEVLFMLPIGARWIADRLDRIQWPAGVQVRSVMEPLTSASTVWNALLAHWNLVKPPRPAPRTAPVHDGHAGDASAKSRAKPNDFVASSGFGSLPALQDLPIASSPMPLFTPMAASAASPAATVDAPPATKARRHPAIQRVDEVIETLSAVDGLMFVAVVDVGSTFVLAAKGTALPVGTLADVAQRVTDLVTAHRRSLQAFGHTRSSDPVDEILVTAGSAYHIIRGLQAFPDCFVVGIADKLRSNLAMTRFRILEAQKLLA